MIASSEALGPWARPGEPQGVKNIKNGTKQVHVSSYLEPAATPITYRGVPADRAVMCVEGTAIVNISNAAL